VSRQTDVAADLELAAAELEKFSDECPPDRWLSTTKAEGWTAAALAYHCALGNDVALAWVCELLDWRPVRETVETHNAANAADAERHARADKHTVLAELRRTTDRTASFLRRLTDEELERSGVHGLAGREMTVGRFIGNFGRHIRDHLASLKAAD
jgi:hypothetical protein